MTVLDIIEKTIEEQISPEITSCWVNPEELAFYILRDLLANEYIILNADDLRD